MNSLLERIYEEERRQRLERLSIVYGVPVSEIIAREKEEARKREIEDKIRKMTYLIAQELTPILTEEITSNLKNALVAMLGENILNFNIDPTNKMSKNDIENVVSKIPIDNIEAMVELFAKKFK